MNEQLLYRQKKRCFVNFAFKVSLSQSKILKKMQEWGSPFVWRHEWDVTLVENPQMAMSILDAQTFFLLKR